MPSLLEPPLALLPLVSSERVFICRIISLCAHLNILSHMFFMLFSLLGLVSTLTTNYLYHPCGVFITTTGVLYVADSYHSQIRTMSSSGVLVSSIYSGLSTPTGLAVSSSGNIYVANNWFNNVMLVTSSGIGIVLIRTNTNKQNLCKK